MLRKALLALLAGVACLVAIVLAVSLRPHPSQPFPVAPGMAPTPMFASPQPWISDHEQLLMGMRLISNSGGIVIYGEPRFDLMDTRAGKITALAPLNRLCSKTGVFRGRATPSMPVASPDGKWIALWTMSMPGQPWLPEWTAARVDGSRIISMPALLDEQVLPSDPVAWRSDDGAWCHLTTLGGMQRVLIQYVLATRQTQQVSIPNTGMTASTAYSPSGDVVVYDGLHLYRCRFGTNPQIVEARAIPSPAGGWEMDGPTLSPTGDRIASSAVRPVLLSPVATRLYTFLGFISRGRIHPPPLQFIRHILVTPVSGGKSQMFDLPLKVQKAYMLGSVRWMPGGKSIAASDGKSMRLIPVQ